MMDSRNIEHKIQMTRRLFKNMWACSGLLMATKRSTQSAVQLEKKDAAITYHADDASNVLAKNVKVILVRADHLAKPAIEASASYKRKLSKSMTGKKPRSLSAIADKKYLALDLATRLLPFKTSKFSIFPVTPTTTTRGKK
uniref:Uncharacterized protein n=1 Tax=Romanomermis culicivorax TaxID=13658 RepID=A0A915JJ11_ROMCU